MQAQPRSHASAEDIIDIGTERGRPGLPLHPHTIHHYSAVRTAEKRGKKAKATQSGVRWTTEQKATEREPERITSVRTTPWRGAGAPLLILGVHSMRPRLALILGVLRSIGGPRPHVWCWPQ